MQIQPKSFSNVIDSILEINIFLFFFFDGGGTGG
jgi:hypothetical protein